MKYILDVFVCLWWLFPSVSQAKVDDGILTEVMHAVVENRIEDADKLFKAAIAKNPNEAENFFWRERIDNTFRETMALNLGMHYNKLHNHEKAYIFYNELIKLDPMNMTHLSGLAELQVCSGKEEEALVTYEKILSIEPGNLSANIFVGNYYFFYAEKSKKRLDEAYAKLVTPTRMQLAAYRNNLAKLLSTEYSKSKQYLEKVMEQFPSTEIKKTLERIKHVETEINK